MCYIIHLKANKHSKGGLKDVYEAKQAKDETKKELDSLQGLLTEKKLVLDIAEKKYTMESAALKVIMVSFVSIRICCFEYFGNIWNMPERQEKMYIQICKFVHIFTAQSRLGLY